MKDYVHHDLYLACAFSPILILLGVWFQIIPSILVNAFDIPDNTYRTSLSFTHATKKYILIFTVYYLNYIKLKLLLLLL